jgi:hypothetical protein
MDANLCPDCRRETSYRDMVPFFHISFCFVFIFALQKCNTKATSRNGSKASISTCPSGQGGSSITFLQSENEYRTM